LREARRILSIPARQVFAIRLFSCSSTKRSRISAVRHWRGSNDGFYRHRAGFISLPLGETHACNAAVRAKAFVS
jgi:hypothetical protein